jgi:D-alanine-D-alanine ligase
MSKPNIAILTGGFSAEANISLLSSQKIHEWIDKEDYQVWLIHITESDWYFESEDGVKTSINKNDFSLHLEKSIIHFQLVVFFPLHGPPAEDGKIQGYFDMLKIPYTGCGVLASAISFDKAACKIYLEKTGVAMAKSVLCVHKHLIKNHELEILKQLLLPVFVKPNKNGSSYGVSKVHKAEALTKALEKAFQFDNEVIVEEFIEGREFSCGVYEMKGETIALPPTEIISQTDFFDYEAKYMGKSKEVTPAELTKEETLEIQYWSKKIFIAVGCKTLSRIDFILKDHTFYLLEVNTTPGMTNESLVPQQVRAAGMNVAWFINSLIEERLKAINA